MLRGNRHPHMPMVQHQTAFQNLAFFLPCQSMEDFPQLTTQLPQYCLASSLRASHIMRTFWRPQRFTIVGILFLVSLSVLLSG